jgi:hypothetical protein
MGVRRGGSRSLPQTLMSASSSTRLGCQTKNSLAVEQSRRISGSGSCAGRAVQPGRHGAPSPSGARCGGGAEARKTAAGAQSRGRRRRGRRGRAEGGRQAEELGIPIAGTHGPPMGQTGLVPISLYRISGNSNRDYWDRWDGMGRGIIGKSHPT